MADIRRPSLSDVFAQFGDVRARVGLFGTHIVAFEVNKLLPEWNAVLATLPKDGDGGPSDIRTLTKLDFFARRLGVSKPPNREWRA